MKKIRFLKKPDGSETVTVYLDFNDEFPQLKIRWITDDGIVSGETWENGLDENFYSEYKAMVNKAINENEPQPCSWEDYAAVLDFLDSNGIVPASCELHELEGREEDVGAFGVQSFPTSHDVPCVGYRIHTADGKTMTIATDLGVLTPPVHEALSGCDLVALESNYDLHMLRSGPYPYYLRARIESTRGHLSNDECSAKLLELIQEGCKKFALCHLSQENNTPALALQTVFNTLGAAGVVPEKDCIVQAQRRNEMSPVLEF